MPALQIVLQLDDDTFDEIRTRTMKKGISFAEQVRLLIERSLALETTLGYTTAEGGTWLPFTQGPFTQGPKPNVHSIRFAGGYEWDARNGWRKQHTEYEKE